jgi:hypothetical protein
MRSSAICYAITAYLITLSSSVHAADFGNRLLPAATNREDTLFRSIPNGRFSSGPVEQSPGLLRWNADMQLNVAFIDEDWCGTRPRLLPLRPHIPLTDPEDWCGTGPRPRHPRTRSSVVIIELPNQFGRLVDRPIIRTGKTFASGFVDVSELGDRCLPIGPQPFPRDIAETFQGCVPPADAPFCTFSRIRGTKKS